MADAVQKMTEYVGFEEIWGLTADEIGCVFDRAGEGKNHRFVCEHCIRGYRQLVAKHKGEVSAQVTVAEKLSDTNLDALKGALKSVTGGKDIDLDVKIDPAIIGGLIVKVGSRMIDSSLRTKLNAIKFAMKEAR